MLKSTSKPSLRRKIILHVLLPLVVTWALGSALAIGLAQYFMVQAYDRSLLDDAHALSAQVKSDSQGAQLNLNLTDAEISSVLYDQSESIYFSVWRADGTLLAGHSGLRPIPNSGRAQAAPLWSDGAYKGNEVRVVSITREVPARFTVLVAQTTASRSAMLRQLVWWSLLPQLLLLAILAWWLRRQVRQDLVPLYDLQTTLDGRDTTDLAHLPPHLSEQARTSDIQHLGVAVNSLFDRLQLGITAQREFSGNVAHELRTPLSGIRLQAEHALTLTTDSAIQERMKKLLASADHASHLIDQLLALAFADEARQGVPLTLLDLTEVVRAAALRHLARADGLQVDLGAEGVEGSPPRFVLGHRVLIDAVLDNLIDNAFRYGRADVNPKITVSLEHRQAEVLLTVTDNGRGLTQQEASHYKGRWAQASDVSGVTNIGQGVGLGLAIVSRYAELLNAQFILETTTGSDGQSGGLCAGLMFAAKS